MISLMTLLKRSFPRFLTSVIALLAFASAHGVENDMTTPIAGRGDVTAYVQKVLDLMVRDDPSASASAFAKITDIPPDSVERMFLAIRQSRGEMIRNFGKSQGITKITSLDYTEYVARDVFLERFERNALVWIFTSYKTASGSWTVLSLKSDKADNLWQHLNPAPRP